MNIRNCAKCGRLFDYISGAPVCPLCKADQEKKLQEVRIFLLQRPKATMEELTQECDLEASLVQQWMREKRLTFTDSSPIKIPCELCGDMIGSGRFCDKCRNEMAKELSGAIRKP